MEMMNDKYEEEKHTLVKELEILKQATSFVDQELHNFVKDCHFALRQAVDARLQQKRGSPAHEQFSLVIDMLRLSVSVVQKITNFAET